MKKTLFKFIEILIGVALLLPRFIIKGLEGLAKDHYELLNSMLNNTRDKIEDLDWSEELDNTLDDATKLARRVVRSKIIYLRLVIISKTLFVANNKFRINITSRPNDYTLQNERKKYKLIRESK